MNEQEARTLAKEVVQKMLAPIFSTPAPTRYPPLRIIDLIYVGTYFTRSMVEFGIDPFDDELYSIFATFPPDQHRVEDFIFRRIMAERENHKEIIEATHMIGRFAETPGAYRRVFISLLKDAVPGGAPGRTRKIKEVDLPELAYHSDRLAPVCKDFLMLRKRFPQRSTQEILEFLVTDSPEQVAYLCQHQKELEQLLQDKKAFRAVKTEKSRSRLIADAMAGCTFGLKASYAVRKAKESRRRSKIDANGRKVQN